MFPWVAQFIRRAADRLPEERLPCWSGFSFYYSSRRQVPLEKIVRRDTETLDQRILDRLGYFRERGLIIFCVAACNGSTTAAKSANRAIERASGTGTPVFVRFLASVVLSLRDRARSLLSKLNSLLGSE
jgi:glutamate racemase